MTPDEKRVYNAAYKLKHKDKFTAYNKKYRERNRDKIKAQRDRFIRSAAGKRYRAAAYAKYADYLTIPSHRMSLLVSLAIKRAKLKGLPYSEVALAALVADPPVVCACCSKTLDYAMQKGRHRPDSPSIDRINNSDGYVLNNIAVVCWRCNAVKSDSSVSELETVIRYIHRRSESN